MVIQHNIPATNAYRQLNTNQSALSKNLEKLSSGYRINRAADDAAGLAISESMRSKINGLDQATANANDAIGLIQTEEGALTETHSMLQRMTTLATQAANGTYNKTSRASIQKEMDELGKEINRIANNTDYNGIKPLAQKGENGQVDTMTMQIGATKGETLTLNGSDMTTNGIFSAIDTAKKDTAYKDLTKDQKTQYEADLTAAANDLINKNNITGATVKVDTTTGALTVTADKDAATKNLSLQTAIDAIFTEDKKKGLQASATDNSDGVKATGDPAKFTGDASGLEYLQIESTEGEDPTANANQVVQNIQKAIDHVSSYRADLGAKQNRLEHTINNLKVTSENTTAAESRIRDTDMAKEIASYTKNNILSQAAQSMLGQANQSGQGVLSLLQ
ncbi:flagellin N-terminal helical domain-containing protein [Oribacterium sp. HCP28S3_H8]|uniref:flagellin N-terminal helical domain-containing protein n=1 Tax=Oribacterium sp. HCP28S3_H8 TaxID=3438945 RepID=UPI003F8A2C34